MKIIEIAATRWHILKLKCTKFNFGWRRAPYPAGGAQRCPDHPPAGFQGYTSNGKGRERI